MRTFEFSQRGYEQMKNYKEFLGGLIKFNDVKASKKRFKVSLLLILLIAGILGAFGPAATIAYSSKDIWIFNQAMKFITKTVAL